MIIKLAINKGAIFDYEDIVCKIPMNTGKIRTYLEGAISKEDTAKQDLRIRYNDQESQLNLLCFIKKGYRFGIMQTYILQGICQVEDYYPEMEHDGTIKEWLEVEIE